MGISNVSVGSCRPEPYILLREQRNFLPQFIWKILWADRDWVLHVSKAARTRCLSFQSYTGPLSKPKPKPATLSL